MKKARPLECDRAGVWHGADGASAGEEVCGIMAAVVLREGAFSGKGGKWVAEMRKCCSTRHDLRGQALG